MASTAIATVMKMIESLPEDAQDQVVEHLRDYLEEMKDDSKWANAFKKTQPQLIAAARRAKREIAEGRAKPLNRRDL
jgi:gamma-glutamyl:cysteine ligase YbdK (ATP-grasp superfamily)